MDKFEQSGFVTELVSADIGSYEAFFKSREHLKSLSDSLSNETLDDETILLKFTLASLLSMKISEHKDVNNSHLTGLLFIALPLGLQEKSEIFSLENNLSFIENLISAIKPTIIDGMTILNMYFPKQDQALNIHPPEQDQVNNRLFKNYRVPPVIIEFESLLREYASLVNKLIDDSRKQSKLDEDFTAPELEPFWTNVARDRLFHIDASARRWSHTAPQSN